MRPTLIGNNVEIAPIAEGLMLRCPFCRTKIYTIFADDKVVKEMMGRHLAKNHKSEMERVLGRLEKHRNNTGFKKGL